MAIRTPTPAEREHTVGTLTLAFAADPIVRWVFPEGHTYLRKFPGFVERLAGNAYEHDTAFCTEDAMGVALWLKPGDHYDEEELVEYLTAAIPEDRQTLFIRLMEQLSPYPPSEPHWYLPLVGVDPMCQGRGYGSQLLNHVLSICDRECVTAYLESSNERNVPLYQRHGFEVLAELQVEGSPVLRPMARKPR